MPQLSLADAAELVVLAADDHAPSFDRWAGRRAARHALDEANVTLGEAQLVLAGLAGLREGDRRAAALALIAVFAALVSDASTPTHAPLAWLQKAALVLD